MKPLIRLLLLTLAWVAAGSSAQTAPSSLGPSAPVTEIDRVVAVVNTDVITFLEVEMRRRSVERQLRQRRIEAPPEEELRKQVLERLISDRALVQAARDAGLRVDDAQLDRVQVCRLGRRHAAERVITQESPRGETMYWIGAAGAAKDDAEGTDFHAMHQGVVTVTPLQIDLTEHDQLSAWQNHLSAVDRTE